MYKRDKWLYMVSGCGFKLHDTTSVVFIGGSVVLKELKLPLVDGTSPLPGRINNVEHKLLDTKCKSYSKFRGKCIMSKVQRFFKKHGFHVTSHLTYFRL